METRPEAPVIQPGITDAAAIVPSQDVNSDTGNMAPQPAGHHYSTCGVAPERAAPSHIYAVGRIEPRFPSIAVEKEFAQATARAQTKRKTDREVMQAVLSLRENRYLARQLCWVLSVQGLETYLLTPRDPADFDQLVESVRPTPRPTDLDVVIGSRGPIAPPEMCNGLMVPIVAFDQVYSFDVTR